MIKEMELLENKELRERLKERTEVLTKVKALFLLPNTEYATTEQAAKYYDVTEEVIRQVFVRFNDELISDGAKTINGNELREIKSLSGLKTRAKAITIFTQRSMLRIAMVLRDSKIAKEIRTQLLNTFENTADEIKIKEIDEEKKLLFNIVMANSPEEQMMAVSTYKNYMERFKEKASKWDTFISQNGCHTFTEVAKMVSTHAQEENINLSITVSKLTGFLRDKGVLSKAKSHDSYLNLPNKDYENYFNTTSIDINKNGKEFKKTSTKVKSNGVEYIYDLLKNEYAN